MNLKKYKEDLEIELDELEHILSIYSCLQDYTNSTPKQEIQNKIDRIHKELYLINNPIYD